MSAVTNATWPPPRRTRGSLPARLRARLNKLERDRPRAFVLTLVITLDAALFAALSFTELFP